MIEFLIFPLEVVRSFVGGGAEVGKSDKVSPDDLDFKSFAIFSRKDLLIFSDAS